MKRLELHPQPACTVDGWTRHACEVRRLNGDTLQSSHSLWFDLSPEAPAWDDTDAEPYLIACLMLAMHEGRSLRVHARVSRTLLENLEEYAAFWVTTAPERYQHVTVEVDEVVPHTPAPTPAVEAAQVPAAIAAFSGGLDASFLVWRHHTGLAGLRNRQIRAAVMIAGFDIPCDSRAHFDASFAVARGTLQSLGITPYPLRTNLRQVIKVPWAQLHGTSLAACLQFYKAIAPTALLGSSEPYNHLVTPWGCSPTIDHLLSSDSLRIVHDGAEHSRSDKARLLAEWPFGADRIRVCWSDTHPGSNCQTCEKCLRTMANFAVHGLPVPASLGGDVDRLNQRIGSVRLRSTAQAAEWRALRLASKTGTRDRWQRWITPLLWGYQLRTVFRTRLRPWLRRLVGLPPTRRAAAT
jgi:hypothetical protein